MSWGGHCWALGHLQGERYFWQCMWGFGGDIKKHLEVNKWDWSCLLLLALLWLR